MPSFNNRIKQVLLLILIIVMLILVIKELQLFLPGILGALTLYILSRASYFQLTYTRKWKKGWAAGLFLLYYTILIGIPVFLAITLISPKINAFLEDPEAMVENVKSSIQTVQNKIGFNFVSEGSLTQSLGKLTAFLPTLLNSTATLVTNLAIMLFFLYYMLVNGAESERKTQSDYSIETGKHQHAGARNKTNGKSQRAGYSIDLNHSGCCSSIGLLSFLAFPNGDYGVFLPAYLHSSP
ncbi:MAG: AI-2E family transporter [Chitinophagaceae bacterium]|nr:AI-2E family transporter [Chitinophagaceae bacterium]